MVGGGVLRSKLVAGEYPCQLAWNRDGSSRPVGLRRDPVALTVHLPGELDLGIIEISKLNVGPRQAEDLG